MTLSVFLVVDHQRLQHGDRTALYRLDKSLDRGAQLRAGRSAQPQRRGGPGNHGGYLELNCRVDQARSLLCNDENRQ